MLEKVREILKRFDEIEQQLADPAVARDPARSASLMKERGRLARTAALGRELEEILRQKAEAETLRDDPDMRKMAREEIETLSAREEKVKAELEELVLVQDEKSSRNVIVEIRPGTGGEEAALFAAELYRMYQKYAERMGWKFRTVDLAETDLGGVKYANITIEGNDVYRHLHFESGTHRVQRVPRTESSGRIHTSAATVAVLPEAEDVDVDINPKDLKIDTFSAGGPGGQHVNKTQSAVRITHGPTGIVVSCQNERSQLRNRDLAMRWLRAKLFDHHEAKQMKQIADLRRTQVGTGDRSEKIRTYNFPQSRVTDHRITFSVHNLEEVLDGHMDELVAKLIGEEKAKKLKALSDKKKE
ncbi:MAG: peptide chain release factor 1 [Planctomycetota bacterium]|jgi:peptide chain release factor 1